MLVGKLDVVGVVGDPVERLDGAGHSRVVLGATGRGQVVVVEERYLSYL